MKHVFKILVCLLFIWAPGLSAETVQQRTPIASNGETDLVANSPKLSVQVKIRTHEVQIGKPSDERPRVIRSNCTYSKYPCSLVDSIEIMVSGKLIVVPRSVFSDLADLNMGELKVAQKESTLTLVSGDASESHIIKIEFDAARVKRRVVSSGMAQNQPLQETNYHLVGIGD
jgi:hypothetical protein